MTLRCCGSGPRGTGAGCDTQGADKLQMYSINSTWLEPCHPSASLTPTRSGHLRTQPAWSAAGARPRVSRQKQQSCSLTIIFCVSIRQYPRRLPPVRPPAPGVQQRVCPAVLLLIPGAPCHNMTCHLTPACPAYPGQHALCRGHSWRCGCLQGRQWRPAGLQTPR